ncbi:hypothetical protein DH2020_008110 [Rehmannia glutinosa]|uniref:DUF4283 domain-containing protein n=1 Tax=Rehmannia glutinosa TaxID=99300 RepID=A0ABR0U0X6_REHGL
MEDLTEQEALVVDIDADTTTDLPQKNSVGYCLAGTLRTHKTVNSFYLLEVMKKGWKPRKGYTAREWGKICFSSDLMTQKREWVIDNQPWHFEGFLFAIKAIDGSEQPSSISITETPFWTRFYDLPVSCMNEKVLSLLVKQIGTLVAWDSSGDSLFGNGNSIHVWKDPWLPSEHKSHPSLPQGETHEDMVVRDLLLVDRAEWNVDLVHQLFTQEDAQTILSIPSRNYWCEDRRLGISQRNGQYSVKSGYRVGMAIDNKFEIDLIVRIQKSYGNGSKLQVPPKVQICVWKMLQRARLLKNKLFQYAKRSPDLFVSDVVKMSKRSSTHSGLPVELLLLACFSTAPRPCSYISNGIINRPND